MRIVFDPRDLSNSSYSEDCIGIGREEWFTGLHAVLPNTDFGGFFVRPLVAQQLLEGLLPSQDKVRSEGLY